MEAVPQNYKAGDLSPSSTLHEIVPGELRAILCFAFDLHAEPGEVRSFKRQVLAQSVVLHAVESSGSFDFMVEAAVPDMNAYQDVLSSLAGPIARLVARCEENFVCRRYVRRHEDEHAIWVPATHGYKRIDCRLIDKITAEGDYMRVHSRGYSWLLHTTMKALAQRLEQRNFLRVNRSAIVRLGFIEGLVHEGSHWLVQLSDSTQERVARSALCSVQGILRTASSIKNSSLTNGPSPTDKLDMVHRQTHAPLKSV